MDSVLGNLAHLRTDRTRRISSYDRTGGNADRISLQAGETVTLARIDGPGTVRHIWCTINHPDPLYRRNLILRMYWDGSRNPSVECPIGDFFGQGWGEAYNYAALPLAASPKQGRALNCYFAMPFSNGATITLENDGTTTLTGKEEDDSALYGLLKKVRDSGMPLLSLNIVDNLKEKK